MTTENARIWAKAFNTPEDKLKKFTRTGGFSGKSIDPVYRLQRLTELFGPCGIGWGFEQTKVWREEFPGKDGPAPVVFVRGKLWYTEDGNRYETCEHTGGTVADRTPDEAYKMAETDALGKCAVCIGLAADVYLGLHDGDKYQRPEAPTQPEKQPSAEEAPTKRPTSEPAGYLGAVAPCPNAILERVGATTDMASLDTLRAVLREEYGNKFPAAVVEVLRTANLGHVARAIEEDGQDLGVLTEYVDKWPFTDPQKTNLYKLLRKKKEAA